MTICGCECCKECPDYGKECKGCEETGGHPCGGECVAAQCILSNGIEGFLAQKQEIIEEINGLGIPGLQVSDMNLLMGAYVNLAYPLANGDSVQLLNSKKVYYGNQIEREGSERCLGVIADESILVVCEYGCNGATPELLLYKKRNK